MAGRVRHFSAPRVSIQSHDRYTDSGDVSMQIRTTILTAIRTAIRTSRWCTLPLAGFVFVFVFVLCAWMPAGAQTRPDPQKEDRQSPATPGADYSGMYSFLRDGELVQLTVEDNGQVIGFVSRYANPEGEGGFLEHFFKSGTLARNQLAFTTETVHGVSFEFRGTVERGEGKSRGAEAYYVLKGALVENATDEAKKTSSRLREVVLKSFPQDLAYPQSEKK